MGKIYICNYKVPEAGQKTFGIGGLVEIIPANALLYKERPVILTEIEEGTDYRESIELLDNKIRILKYETRNYKGVLSPKEYNDKIISELEKVIQLLKAIGGGK